MGISNSMIAFSVSDSRLTKEQAEHVSEIGKEFCHMMADKYVVGQAEHGGNLWDLTEDQLLNEAIKEATDQVVYLLTLRRKRHVAAGLRR